MSGSYVGVYWTLPVNWAGFRDLPPDVDAAAAASRTIRYQRERVRGWVRKQGGTLLGEVAFMDTRTDRATDAVRDGNGRWHAFAGLLNGRGIRTIRGGSWKAESVRKLAGRLGLAG